PLYSVGRNSPQVLRWAGVTRASSCEVTGSAFASRLGRAKEKIRISEKKRKVARGAIERRAWRRMGIDLGLVCRHVAKSIMPFGRGFSRIVARPRGSASQLWPNCDLTGTPLRACR